MYNYLVKNPIIATIFLVVVVAFVIFLLVKYFQRVGLEKVRETVYKGFIVAEHEFMYGDNEDKFNYVVDLAKSSIPLPFSLFITDKLLREVIQLWFDLCKDLLDDGKLNGTATEKTNHTLGGVSHE